MGEAVNKGNLDVLREVFAPNVVDHDPAPDQAKGPDGFVRLFTDLRSAFPDLKIAPEQMVTDEDNVAIAYTITGTHQGNFLGIPSTGKKIKARGVQIARFENGKIVERWGSSDELGILKQIGGVKGAESVTQTPAITGRVA
ncbi:MAG: ester cyclase [Acidobacteriaceae bacterium]